MHIQLDENPFADWSAHLFVADRTQYILVCNTKSLYSTVMYAKGITDDTTFIDRVLTSFREFLSDDGQQFVYRTIIAPTAADGRFAKALDRAVTGSMNELIAEATHWLIEEELSPYEVGFRLNDTPLSAIGAEQSKAVRDAKGSVQGDGERDGGLKGHLDRSKTPHQFQANPRQLIDNSTII